MLSNTAHEPKGITDMEPIYYTVTKINGDYAIMVTDDGIENTVAMALLPIDIDEKSRLVWENFEYTIMK